MQISSIAVEESPNRGFSLLQAHHSSRLTRRELLLETLFEKWDINASGFLEMKEVEAALSAFKEGMEKEAVRMGKERAVL